MTSKRRKQEDSATNAASFRLRDVTISMERTSQPEGLKFIIVRKGDANSEHQGSVADGRISTEENGTTLYLAWWDDVTALETHQLTGRFGSVKIAIARNTSKSAGAR